MFICNIHATYMCWKVLVNSFIPGSYITVAPVSRQFFTKYCTVGIDDSDIVNSAETLLKIAKNKRTTADVVSDNVELFEHFIVNDVAPVDFLNTVTCRAASKGRRDILEYALIFGVNIGKVLGEEETHWEEKLVKEGNIDFLKYLNDKFDCFNEELECNWRLKSMIKAASEYGHVHILQWIYEMAVYAHYLFDVEKIVSFGRIECLKWCHDTFGGNKVNFKSCSSCVATSGNVDALKWLARIDGNPFFSEKLFAEAAASGNIKMLEYCHRYNCPSNEDACSNALDNTDKDHALELLKWLRQHKCPWNEETCSSAAENDNMKALKWARSEGCPWNKETFAAAAQNGNIEILEYCLENGCPMDAMACEMAVDNEDDFKALETLKWLRKHSCPWDERTCQSALEDENFPCLMFALGNDCPRPYELFHDIIRSDDNTAFEYCLDKIWKPDSPNDIDFNHIFKSSSDSVMITKLRLLRKYGYELNESFCAWAAERGILSVLRWLRFHGCPWDARTCTSAVAGRNMNILEYAHKNGCEWDESTFRFCFKYCINYESGIRITKYLPVRNYKEIVEYLLEHDCPRPQDFHLEYLDLSETSSDCFDGPGFG
ncbi:hypothetical protein CTEN210_04068 [Chaetoceros tenuissimus]|uniref:Uncharacterized protein n=1 Tax=Chaetoceros tenuissimus TaxID=426638 RepID=A0AAD3CL64_9STRA|nr:hypothetical protein CTEN210_04068 [Chaetoceros tenuissimus]